jgi:hypothetical protein
MESGTQLYHATRRNLSSREIVSASEPTDYYPEVRDLLESRRLHNRPSRSICVFAAESAVAATEFMQAELRKLGKPENDFRLYRVEMNVYHRAPFRLIHELKKRLDTGGDVDSVLNEYWNPKHEWVFWEYFGPSLTVVEEVGPPDTIARVVFKLSYEAKDSLASGKL